MLHRWFVRWMKCTENIDDLNSLDNFCFHLDKVSDYPFLYSPHKKTWPLVKFMTHTAILSLIHSASHSVPIRSLSPSLSFLPPPHSFPLSIKDVPDSSKLSFNKCIRKKVALISKVATYNNMTHNSLPVPSIDKGEM